MSDRKKIVLADASEEFRELLADMIQKEDDLAVCAQTGSGEELLDLISRHRPDVVIMDLMLAEMDGLEVLDELGDDRTRVLVLSAFSTPPLSRGMRRAVSTSLTPWPRAPNSPVSGS